MIRPAGGSWTRWALNVATVMLGAFLAGGAATRRAVQSIRRRTIRP